MFAENQYDASIPIYQQIVIRIKEQIFMKTWKPGEKIPAVRDLALSMGVNPNTMQKALMELEREGLLYAERTTGRFVTSDSALIESTHKEAAHRMIREFLERMEKLGYQKEDIKKEIERIE